MNTPRAASTPATRRLARQALPEASAADQAAITAFLERIWAEQGLARPTLDAYRRDLEGLARWLRGRGKELAAADQAALFDYLAERSRQYYAPRSNARLLSALRAFYAQQLRFGAIDRDPTALLEPPRLGRSLPKALSESEIEALLQHGAGDDAPEAVRDRAMLELMYACGLRVSELVNLPSTAVNLRQGVLRVMGKGSKERLVPMGEEAQAWLERYLRDARPAPARCSCNAMARRRRASNYGRASSVVRAPPASIRRRSARMGCATVSPPTCSIMAPTCARCRCCSGTPA